jgi:hypothetical protein
MSDAAKSVHELLRLAAGTENKVNDDIKFQPAEFGLMVLERLAVAKNLFDSCGQLGVATMEDGNIVAAFQKLFRREASDKTAAADEKDFHDCNFSGAKAYIFKIDLRALVGPLFHRVK